MKQARWKIDFAKTGAHQAEEKNKKKTPGKIDLPH